MGVAFPFPLLARDGCIDVSKCDKPKCPSCKSGQVCTFTPASCDECSKGLCVDDPLAKNNDDSSSKDDGDSKDDDGGGDSGSKAGGIAGGVIGGVVVIGLIVGFILWKKYYSKARIEQARNSKSDELGPLDADAATVEKDKRYTQNSFMSVNTSNTRSSNIIPIAYIPGVQNRQSSATSNGGDVPPMPDINSTMYGDQFFSADDILRNSHLTEYNRGSFATDYYRGSTAVIDDTMMTAVTVKPNLVTLNDTGNNNNNTSESNSANSSTASVSTAQAVNAYQIGSARAVNSSRANAHSIRIGKSIPIGLQHDTIDEDAEENPHKEEEQREQKPHPLQQFTHNASNSETSQASDGLTNLPFVIENTNTNNTNYNKNSNNNNNNSNNNNNASMVMSISEASTSTSSFQSAHSNPAITETEQNQQQRESRETKTPSRQSSRQSSRKSKSSSNRSSRRTTGRYQSEYVMEDMPIEAYLFANSEQHRRTSQTQSQYAQNNNGKDKDNNDDDEDANLKNGRISPFDDRYTL